MKVNEAPEKIYLYPSRLEKGKILGRWFMTRYNQDSVEYTRTDALIEKACEWIDFFLRDLYIFNSNDMQGVIEEFKKAMQLWHKKKKTYY